IKWLLDHVKCARKRAVRGELAFGNIDSFLIWRLTGGKLHSRDATNASRTMLFNIETNGWDEELLRLLDVPAALLPEVKDCAADFGMTEAELFGAAIPIRGVAGDQHAATIGQACFEPGMLKSTYGTGCFALLKTGADLVRSKNRLLTTIAYRLDGKTTYALEGSIFVAGAAVQWLRDGLRLFKSASETGALAKTADPTQSVYMVPAFVGLGAPWWDAEARGAIFGLTRDAGLPEIAAATYDACALQTRDLIEAMRLDAPTAFHAEAQLRIDGGMSKSAWFSQRLSDLTGLPVHRAAYQEATALGAALFAGVGAGIYDSLEAAIAVRPAAQALAPGVSVHVREAAYARWLDAVPRVRT
ncbi:MAG: glycerol kinase, partial [Caulobacter sp.]|nr:glycerol kinase [Caulobacter sp.]